MTDTVRVPKAFSDWLYGVEGYGLRVERLSEELRDPVDKLLPWLLAAFEVGLSASPQGEGSSADAHTPQPDAPGWRDIATAPKDGTMLLVGYDEGVAREGAMEDRQRVFEARWNDVQGTWSARNGFLLHSDATHWQPLPHPPSAHPAPIKPSGDTGELRERVAQIIGEAVNRRALGQIVFSTLEDADAILDLIQSEKAG